MTDPEFRSAYSRIDWSGPPLSVQLARAHEYSTARKAAGVAVTASAAPRRPIPQTPLLEAPTVNIKPPNEVHQSAPIGSSGNLGRHGTPVTPPNGAFRGGKPNNGTASLAKHANPIHPPNERPIATGNSEHPPHGAPVQIGKGAIPVEGFTVNGVPARIRKPMPDKPSKK